MRQYKGGQEAIYIYIHIYTYIYDWIPFLRRLTGGSLTGVWPTRRPTRQRSAVLIKSTHSGLFTQSLAGILSNCPLFNTTEVSCSNRVYPQWTFDTKLGRYTVHYLTQQRSAVLMESIPTVDF